MTAAALWQAVPLTLWALDRAGLEVREVESVSLTAGGVAITGLKLEAPVLLKAERVEIDVGLADVRAQRIGRVAIDGLDLALNMATFAAEPKAEVDAEPLATISERLEQVVLTNADIRVLGEGLGLDFEGDASLQAAGNSVTVRTASASNMAMRTKELDLSLEGIDLKIQSSTDLGIIDGTFRVAALRHAHHPAYFSKLAVEGNVGGGIDRLTFMGRVTPHRTDDLFMFNGEIAPATGAGLVRFETDGFTFAPDGLRLTQLSEMASPLFETLNGTIRVIGKVDWGEDPSQRARVAFVDVDMDLPPVGLREINGVVDFDSLWPPRTLPRQRLAIGVLDLGLPLTRGMVTVGLEESLVVDVDQLQFDWAAGRLWAEPFALQLDDPTGQLTLKAKGLDLPAVLEHVGINGLEAEGVLDGELPLLLRADRVVEVRGGMLAARDPGIIRYRPEQAPAMLSGQQQSVGLLMQALENLHYRTLDLTMNGPTDGEMTLGLSIAGANPDLYGGYPIEFNLNLEGELATIVARNIETYALPENIAESLRGFQ